MIGASMGPPPFGDGDGTAASGPGTLTSSFNGATAFRRWRWHSRFWAGDPDIKLQWGHRLSAMEITVGWPGVPFEDTLQWGHRLSAMERPRSTRWPTYGATSFNGATAFRRWKQEHPDLPAGHRRNASMGPPPFGDGKHRHGRLSRLRCLASMGPPPVGDGNNTAHRHSGGVGHASMGPPPVGDGNGYFIGSSVVA